MQPYKSRLAEVEEKKSIRSAILFGGGTILLIIFGLVFGIPLFSKFVNLFNRSSVTVDTQSVTLLPPNLSPLTPYTNKQALVISGTAASNSNVRIFVNDASNDTSSDGDGNFSISVTLNKGNNTIFGQTIDSKGNVSRNSTTYTVNYVNKEPSLTVNSPQNNQTFYGSAQQNLTIDGSTDAGNTVTINDHVAILDINNKFNYPFELQNGDNTLKIIATDPAGNKKEIDLKVTYNP